MNESNTNVNMDSIRAELSGLSEETLSYIGFDVNANMIRRPPSAGARRGITRPTTNDRNVMQKLIESFGTYVTSAQIARQLDLQTKDVSYCIRFLIENGFVVSEGQGPTMSYTAMTQNPDFVDVVVSPGRRSGHKPGPSAAAAFIAAVNEQEMLEWFSKKSIVERAIEMFPNAEFKDSSFGAIPTKLIQQGMIEGRGKAKKREFQRLVDTIEGAAQPSALLDSTLADDNVVVEDIINSADVSPTIVTEGQ